MSLSSDTSETLAVTGVVVRVFALTDVGRTREHNEDAFLLTDRVFAVADGMGGHAAGEVASRLAVESLAALAALAVITVDDVTAERIERPQRLVALGDHVNVSLEHQRPARCRPVDDAHHRRPGAAVGRAP